MSILEAAIAMRKAIGQSRAWTAGYLLTGDEDGVLYACREFDAALGSTCGYERPNAAPCHCANDE